MLQPELKIQAVVCRLLRTYIKASAQSALITQAGWCVLARVRKTSLWYQHLKMINKANANTLLSLIFARLNFRNFRDLNNFAKFKSRKKKDPRNLLTFIKTSIRTYSMEVNPITSRFIWKYWDIPYLKANWQCHRVK